MGFYSVGIFLLGLALRLAAWTGNTKAQKWIKGRKQWKNQLTTLPKNAFWIHCASLGEYEQAKPILQKIKSELPQQPVLLTFFSPSGFELQRNTTLAHAVAYLPLDTQANAQYWINSLKPRVAIFVKAEWWLHYIQYAQHKNIPVLSIATHIHPKNPLLKWWGAPYRRVLKGVSFFTQTEQDTEILKNLGFTAVTAGDPRAHTVKQIPNESWQDPLLVKFINNTSNVAIVGSAWENDLILLNTVIAQLPNWKFIIAPHEISPAHIQKFRNLLNMPTMLYSNPIDTQAQVCIVDQIGILKKMYRLGTVAWIGGGFKKGIHNTLEPAAYGLPIAFGPRYTQFNEAIQFVALGAAYSCTHSQQALQFFKHFESDAARQQVKSTLTSYFQSIPNSPQLIFEALPKL